jgi:hypothetical protein
MSEEKLYEEQYKILDDIKAVKSAIAFLTGNNLAVLALVNVIEYLNDQLQTNVEKLSKVEETKIR